MRKGIFAVLSVAFVSLTIYVHGQRRVTQKAPPSREQVLANEAYAQAKQFWDAKIPKCDNEYYFASQSVYINNRFVFECRRMTGIHVNGQTLYPRQLSEAERLNGVDPLPVEWQGGISIDFQTCRQSMSGNGFQPGWGSWYDQKSIGPQSLKKVKGKWQLGQIFHIGNDEDRPLSVTCADIDSYLGRNTLRSTSTAVTPVDESTGVRYDGIYTFHTSTIQPNDSHILWLRFFNDHTALFVTTDGSFSFEEMNRCFLKNIALRSDCGTLSSHVFQGSYSKNSAGIGIQVSSDEGRATFNGNVYPDSLQLNSRFPNGTSGNLRFTFVPVSGGSSIDASEAPTNRIEIDSGHAYPIKSFALINAATDEQGNTFAQSRVTYINFHIYYQATDYSYSLDARDEWYKDGKLWIPQYPVHVEPLNGHIWNGKGWAEPGHWETGSYTVRVYVGKQLVAMGSFSIVPG